MVTRFLERRSVALIARGARRSQRGSQSLEWVALGGLVATALGAATHMAGSDGFGTALANAIFQPVKSMLAGGKG
jgi:hypothetical protein